MNVQIETQVLSNMAALSIVSICEKGRTMINKNISDHKVAVNSL